MKQIFFTSVANRFDLARVTRWLAMLSLMLLFPATSVFARQVTLAWNANPEPILGGYRLYYGQTSRNYTVVEDVGNQTTYTLFGLADDRPYYFAVTAYDSTNRIESAFSWKVRSRVRSKAGSG